MNDELAAPVQKPVHTRVPRKRGRPIPATHCVGIVTELEEKRFRVTSGDLLCRARRASSCLLEPAIGDSVACLLVAPHEVWILAVLQREEGVDNVLRCEGPTRFEVDNGAFALRAGSLDFQSKRFDLRADQVEVVADEALLVGREHRLVGQVVKLVGALLSTTFDAVTHFSRQHTRTTEGIDRVQATFVEQEAKKLLRLSGEHALINGEKLIKARGGQIHFG